MLWLAAWRAADMLQDDDGRETIGRETLVPFATLIVLVVCYGCR
jgi:hypothetical protein